MLVCKMRIMVIREIGKTEVTRTDHAGTLYETVGSTTTEWKDPIIIKPEEKDKK